MTNHARLLKRALAEKLSEEREKVAFIPMTAKEGQQAAGPGGAPIDPMAGGAPMDPMAAGGAPMDPMAGGAPMDPMAAGGAPPMDPMAGGAMDPMAGLPPLPEEGGEEIAAEGEAQVSQPDVEALKDVQQNTMEIVRQTLEMVGKAKPQEAADGKPEEAASAEPPPPEAQPGPVTGQPGFDPSAIGGPLKMALAKKAAEKKASVASLISRGMNKAVDTAKTHPKKTVGGVTGIAALKGLQAAGEATSEMIDDNTKHRDAAGPAGIAAGVEARNKALRGK